MKAPTLKTYEEFIQHFEKDTDAFKMTVWKQYVFACKERDRLRAKDKRARDKKRDAIPPEQRKKIGRPRLHPPALPVEMPGVEFSA